jgi:hypothetical protein
LEGLCLWNGFSYSSALAGEGTMKNYRAMRFVAGLLKLIGWLTVAVGVVVLVVSITAGQNVPVTPYVSPGAALLIAVLISASIIILGIFNVAAGEMISALADMAVNSAYLPAIAANTQKTVGFFEHISNGGSAAAAPPVRS